MIDSSDARRYIVDLTGMTNAQNITVGLTNIVDVAGNTSSAVSVTMGVLIGDVNGNGLVDGNDVSAVQSQTRQPVTGANFQYDVNTDGIIDGNDVSLTQGHTRTSLPSAPQLDKVKLKRRFQRISGIVGRTSQIGAVSNALREKFVCLL